MSRPDICARLARTASRVNLLKGSDVYRINDLVKTVKVWQQAAVLKYFSSSRVSKYARGGEDERFDIEERKYMREP